MTSREIIQLKQETRRFIAQKKIKEAFASLNKLAARTQDWQISEQLNELETNYKYMLHYLFEGVQDPERDSVYTNLLRSLYEITDDAADQLLNIESSNFFYEKLRLNTLQGKEFDYYHNELSQLTMSISVTGLLDESDQKRKLSVKRERLSDELFNAVFVSERANNKSIQDYYFMLNSIDLASREKSVFIAALTLNLIHRFDSLKLQVLMHAAKSDDVNIRARAIVGLVIIMQLYDTRWNLYPELKQQLDSLSENPKFKRAVLEVIIQFVRSKETEEISRKLTEEIIPEMMRFNRKTGESINMESLMSENDLFEKNPEWAKELEESGLDKKLQEYTDLQMEGADVFHSTFANLKAFPFFSDLSNWFMPFDTSYSIVAPLFANTNTILSAAISESGHMCNSDKYSFCLSLLQISSSQREMMLGRLNAESEEVKKLQQDAKNLNPQIDEELKSNQYIQDLYRFFKLHPRKASFFDIFQMNINFHKKETISPLISDVESITKIANYCFEKNYFTEALEIYSILAAKEEAGENVWQKIAYCFQVLGNSEKALEAYLKADLISPNNSWILRHIAQLYRSIADYDKAISYYHKTAKLTPDNLHLELNIGHCYLEKEDYEEALNYYFKVEMLDTNSDRALRPIAWTAFMLNRHELAQRYYERILAKKPSAHDYLNAAHVMLVENKNKKAIELYRHSVELSSIDEFAQLFDADQKTLVKKGIDTSLLPFIVDQVKYLNS